MPDFTSAEDAATLQAFLDEHHIDMVRMEGTNLDSSLVGKMIAPRKALSSLSSGVGFVDLVFGADLHNVPQMGYPYPNWRGDLPDVFLRPDVSTLLEWAPGQASMLGNFHDRWGKPLPVCPRTMLQRVCDRASAAGYSVNVAIEIEASVFEESIEEARAKGYRNLTPLGGNAGFCYHMAKDRSWHEYMTAVSRRLDALGIPWDAWNDEAAVGQIELNIAMSDPVTACDRWTRTRQVMREVAFELGRSVTFMAKWCDEYGQASHINLSLSRDGDNALSGNALSGNALSGNAFYAEGAPSEVMNHFIGGTMQTLAATTCLALPWITSYRRVVDYQGPPTTVTWGINNKYTAIRAVVGDPKLSRIEYRIPGADSNTYLVTAAVLASGLYGIDHRINAPEPFDAMAYFLPEGTVERLPATIGQAIATLQGDTTLRKILGDEAIDYWLGTRRWEWMQYHDHGGEPEAPITDWELSRYFELV